MNTPLALTRTLAWALSLLPLAPLPARAHDPAPQSATPTPAAATARFLTAEPKLAVIGQARDFVLHDTRGEPVRLSDLRGRAVLLAFIYTSCTQACPLITRQMALLQAQLKREGLFPDKSTLLSVTVDPQADTAEVLGRYAQTFGADPAGWRFLLDDPEPLRAVLDAYGEWTKRLPKGDVDHPARLYLIDPRGDIREIYSLAFFDEKQAFLDMASLLREPR